MPFRLNAPQTESDFEDAGTASGPFGGTGVVVENSITAAVIPPNRHNSVANNSTANQSTTQRAGNRSNSSNQTANNATSAAAAAYTSRSLAKKTSSNALEGSGDVSMTQSFNNLDSTATGRTGIGREEALTVGVKDKEEKEFDADNASNSRRSLKWVVGTGVAAMLVLIGLIVAVSLALTRNNDNGDDGINGVGGSGSSLAPGETAVPTQEGEMLLDPDSTLGRIYNEGIIRCGVPVEQPGFAQIDTDSDRMEGFDADLCRAVASAIFGPDNLEYRIEFMPTTAFDRFQDLHDGKFDVLARTTTHTMEREVLESNSGTGFDFSVPYLYNGLQFAGVPSFVECADSGNTTGTCADTKICVLDGTTHVDVILKLNPDSSIVAAVNPEFLHTNFISGFCNVIAAEQFDLAETLVRDLGYTGDYGYGSSIHSKEPLCIVTRDDDQQFSDFVNWVMEILISAEEGQISQDRAAALKDVAFFGPTFKGMARDAVAAVGNYGEIYERNLERLLPRSDTNSINDGSNGGIIYALPFGSLTAAGPGPANGGTLEKILDRGFLKCGVSTRVIFAQQNDGTWSGFDIDFCKALSAAIFDGVTDTIEYTDLSASERFVALADGDVDVLSRLTTVTLERDVNETATGQGFNFAQPNFYDGMLFGGIPPYGSCADDLTIIGGSCQDISICVNAGTTFESVVKTIFPERVVVSREGDALEGLSDGACNVIAGGVTDVSQTSVRNAGYTGAYETGSGRYSKDPLAMVTRQDDVQWSKFVFWIVSALFYAEEEGISSEDADAMPEVSLFGEEFRNMFVNAVAAVGNYGDIYDRSAQEEVSRGGLNELNVFLANPQFYPLPGIL